MIGIGFREAKALFFDSQGIIKAFSRAERRVFSQFGGFTRTTARRSMRTVGKRKRKAITAIIDKLKSPAARYNEAYRTRLYAELDAARRAATSPPNHPPNAIVGTIKKLTVFAADTQKHSVVIGPTLANKPTGAPRNLEEGGTATLVSKKTGKARTVKIKKRPFMKPAFDKAKSRLPKMWRDSIRKG
jgi:hypothetical protein